MGRVVVKRPRMLRCGAEVYGAGHGGYEGQIPLRWELGYFDNAG